MAFDERPAPLQWAGTAAVLLGLVINQGLLSPPRRNTVSTPV
jgi:drug/metabolite transporter (DMT)-like permease